MDIANRTMTELLKPIWGRKYFFDLLTFRKTYYSQNKVYFFPLYCFLVWICWTKNQGLLPFSYDPWLSQECFKNLILVKTQFLKESFFFESFYYKQCQGAQQVRQCGGHSCYTLVSELQMAYCETLNRNLVKEIWLRSLTRAKRQSTVVYSLFPRHGTWEWKVTLIILLKAQGLT